MEREKRERNLYTFCVVVKKKKKTTFTINRRQSFDPSVVVDTPHFEKYPSKDYKGLFVNSLSVISIYNIFKS